MIVSPPGGHTGFHILFNSAFVAFKPKYSGVLRRASIVTNLLVVLCQVLLLSQVERSRVKGSHNVHREPTVHLDQSKKKKVSEPLQEILLFSQFQSTVEIH